MADEMRDALEDMVWQFAYKGHMPDGRLALTTGGLSALEGAFTELGWDNPHPCPELECAIADCREEATCGAPTKDGYKRMCGVHYRELAI